MSADLFSPPLARNRDPATSHEAAKRAQAFVQDHCESILGVMWRPMTIYDIARGTGLNHVQVARRMCELERDGRARPTGKTVVGDTGRDCRLWERINAA